MSLSSCDRLVATSMKSSACSATSLALLPRSAVVSVLLVAGCQGSVSRWATSRVSHCIRVLPSGPGPGQKVVELAGLLSPPPFVQVLEAPHRRPLGSLSADGQGRAPGQRSAQVRGLGPRRLDGLALLRDL